MSQQFGSHLQAATTTELGRRLPEPSCLLHILRFLQMNQFINAVFNRPRNPTAILFLVEDSDPMNCLQHSLRDSYLLLVLEVISRINTPGLVSPLTHPSPKVTPNSYTQTQALWMSTSNRHPLQAPLDPFIYHQLPQDHTGLTDGHHGIPTPVSILSAIEVC